MAFIATFGWPLVAMCIFYFSRSFERAIIWSIVVPFLLLPSRFAIDLPGIPPLDKDTVPSLTLLVILLFAANRRLGFMPVDPLARFLFVTAIASPFFTALLNQDPVIDGVKYLPGLEPYDALSVAGQTFITLIPFMVGRSFLASPHAHHEILKILVFCGLSYSLLILFEVRMAPQLHTWIYGYFPSSFAQHIRGGGFRPVVFLQHGLAISFFAMIVMISAAILLRHSKSMAKSARPTEKLAGFYPVITFYLYAVLVLCKSMASIVYGTFLLPVVLLMRARKQIWVAAILALLAITYPATRGTGVFPADTILGIAASISEPRASSLQTRFDNEDILLRKGAERPIFGWGGWGRNRVYHAISGEDASTTDGFWIIQIGSYGWVGFISVFGLLALPILAILRRARRRDGEEPAFVTSGLCLLLAINMIELLPNATIKPWTWLIAGALLGYVEKRPAISTETQSNAPRRQQRTVI